MAQVVIALELDDKGSVKLKNFSGVVDKVEKNVSAASRNMQNAWGRVIRSVSSLHRRLQSMATSLPALLGTAGLAAGTTALTKSIIASRAELERYEVQFKVLHGSIEAARARLKDLTEFAATTPFELPQVIQASKIMKVFGIDTNENLRLVGDAAAAAQAPIQELAMWLGRLKAGNFGEALQRLTELGITTRQELEMRGLKFDASGSFKGSAEEIFAAVQNIIRERFGGMMQEQSRTLEGMLSNMRDWWFKIKTMVSEKIFVLFKQDLQNILGMLDRAAASGALQRWAERISTAFAIVFQAISKTVAFAVNWIQQNKDMIVLGAKVAGVLALIGGTIVALGNPMVQIGLAIVAGIEAWNRWGDTVREAVSGAFSVVRPFLNRTIQGFVFMGKAIFIVAQDMWQAMKDAFLKVWNLAKPIFEALAKAWQYILKLVRKVAEGIGEVWDKTNDQIIAAGAAGAVQQQDTLNKLARAYKETFETDYVQAISTGLQKGTSLVNNWVENMKQTFLSLGNIQLSMPEVQLQNVGAGDDNANNAISKTSKEIITMEKVLEDTAKNGFRVFWNSLTDTSMKGSERIKQVWLSMRDTFMQMTGEMILQKKEEVFQFIALEGKKTAVFLANSAKRMAALVAETAKKLASAAASIAEAAANAIKDAISFLGPFGIPVAIGAGIAIATQWNKIKGMLGFQKGGLVPEMVLASALLLQPQGPDRVPALLEPGEFVIRREVVERVGREVFERINQATTIQAIQQIFEKSEPAKKFQTGGLVTMRDALPIADRDRVPALLEPGEFVIRREVVQKIGAQFFEKLNANENIPRLQAGGMVSQIPAIPFISPAVQKTENQIIVQGDSIFIHGGVSEELLAEIRRVKERSREQLKKDIEFLIKRRRLKL